MKVLLIIFKEAMLSSIFPIGRAALSYVEPIFFTAVRMIVAGILLLAYQFIRYGKLFQNEFSYRKATAWLLFLFIVAGIFATNVPEFWSLKFVPAGKAAFIYSLSPFFAAILAHFFFGERLTLKKFAGILIGLAGFMFMLINDAPAEDISGGIWFLSWGEIALLFASVACVYGWAIMRRLMRECYLSAVEANGISMFFGGILALVFSMLVESPWNPAPVSNWSQFGFYVTIAIITSNLLGYMFYAVLLRTYSTTLLSFAGLLEPPFAALYGFVFLGEALTFHFFISMALVFFGLYIFYMEELKQGYIVQTPTE